MREFPVKDNSKAASKWEKAKNKTGRDLLVHSTGELAEEQVTLDKLIHLGREELTRILWSTDPQIHRILLASTSIIEARNSLFLYLNDLERSYCNIYCNKKLKNLHELEKRHAKWCVRVLKNIIRTENEKLTGTSALSYIRKLALRKPRQGSEVSESFLCELIFLFSGINGKFDFYRKAHKPTEIFNYMENPGVTRSRALDGYSTRIRDYTSRYRDGLEDEIVEKNRRTAWKIMAHFGAGEKEWNDYRWQMRHIIYDLATLEQLVELSPEELHGLKAAEKHGVPFQITPYYLSLFDQRASTGEDATLRALVLPGKQYVDSLIQAIDSDKDLDFMGEGSTSPVDGVTRRYVHVLILKAFDSCPQICVYCQRNWELKGLRHTGVNRKRIIDAIDWIDANDHIEEVLVTGGDPLTLDDKLLKWIMDRLSEIEHVERIRIGTRVPVTMPRRITDEFIEMVSSYHEFGRREVCFVTHFASGLEMTPESLAALKRIRAAGMNIYNQQVFTYYNSRKFQTYALRKLLKRCGVDPYYCFNTKGKEETADFRVPIPRLLQEWTEEARLLPGVVRTDTPVFNVPTLGKNYLTSWQNHEIIMITPEGRRVYRFYPWESMLSLSSPYLYTDVPIYDYLKRLDSDGENVNDYQSIWYYF
ncbi:MAG: KamA family radical SAM protein [Gemmatimonadota bacterium]|nr:KamA family radical SAM protein [Gemmatimonadota bacterium]